MTNRLILRADGNSKIGYGHIFRVLAFAEWYADEYDCVLVTSAPDSIVTTAAKNSGVNIIAIKEYTYLLPSDNVQGQEIDFDMEEVLSGTEVVVTDGYLFGTEYQKKIKNKGCKLVCIDDEAKWHFSADIIINPAPAVNTAIYRKEAYTRVYSGGDYFVLRRCFLAPKPDRTSLRTAVYIAVGGSDYYGYTAGIAAEVLKTKDILVHILYSSAFSAEGVGRLEQLQIQEPGRVCLHYNKSGEEIVNLIDSCTHAIVSASTVSLEVVARGIKPLIGYYVENQLGIYNGLIKEELANGLGNFANYNAKNIGHYLLSDQICNSSVANGIRNILSSING